MKVATSASNAECQRRYRERQRRGLCVVQVEVGERHIGMLIADGWLGDRDATEAESLGAAIKDILDALAKKSVMPYADST